jgi:transcriptional regulator with XRE-family HTH domain
MNRGKLLPARRDRAAHPDIAARLRRLRLIYGPTAQEFCLKYKFSQSQWSNYEAGFFPSIYSARQLVAQIDGLTLDWIYDGKIGGVTVMMARILNATPDE